MPVMHTAIPCTGNTADQAVSTVHLQLGAAKHLTRPLRLPWQVVLGSTTTVALPHHFAAVFERYGGCQ